MAVCNCNDGVSGFGLPSCVGGADRPLGYGFQKLKNGASFNALSGQITQSIWEGALWNENKNLRINTVVLAKNITDERADPNTEDVDGVGQFVSEGARIVTFELYGVPAKLKAFIEGLRCGEYGFYEITASNELAGLKVGGNLRPIPMEKGTIFVKYFRKTKSTLQKLMVSFQVSENYNDADFGYIPSDDITADLLGTDSQIEANPTLGTITGVSVELTLDFVVGDSTTPIPLEGMDQTSYFKLYNNTTAAVVVVAGVVEGDDGLYTISFVAQTTSDSLTISPSTLSPFTFEPVDFVAV